MPFRADGGVSRPSYPPWIKWLSESVPDFEFTKFLWKKIGRCRCAVSPLVTAPISTLRGGTGLAPDEGPDCSFSLGQYVALPSAKNTRMDWSLACHDVCSALCSQGSRARGGEPIAARRSGAFGPSSSKPVVATGAARCGEQTLGHPAGVRAPGIPSP